MKASKESIVGLLVALQRMAVKKSVSMQHLQRMVELAGGFVRDIPGVETETVACGAQRIELIVLKLRGRRL